MESHLANEDSVDLSDIFCLAPEAFQPFMFVSTSSQVGELKYLGRNECIYKSLKISVGI